MESDKGFININSRVKTSFRVKIFEISIEKVQTMGKRESSINLLTLSSQDRDYEDKILAEGEDIEMMKKHEQEKMAAMTDDEVHVGDDMEAVSTSP